MDDRRPRSSFLKLLSEPDFDFTPYFDKAVVQWLERNMGDFLKEAPHACKYFINDPDYQATVAEHLPVEDDALVLKFIKNFGSSWQSAHAIDYLIPKLVEAGKADLMLSCLDHIKNHSSERVKTLVEAFSNEGIIQVLENMDLKRCRWDNEARIALIKRVPTNLIAKIEPLTWEWVDARDRAQTVSTLATKWPIEDIANFLAIYSGRYSALSCMSCGEKTAKSKPGYTLHRKSCDPENKYPNIWTILAIRSV